MSGQSILSIHEALVTFGGKPLFEELSFNLHEADRISLVGKNGSGKTTLMRLITGTLELDSGTRWTLPGITVGYLMQDVEAKFENSISEYVFKGLNPERQNDDYRYMVDMVLEPLELDGSKRMEQLSGGQLRRAALARALVEEPDILLLDEPTNHLDLSATLWLEEYLKMYRGTLLCVSHDKTFLANISNKIFWLDRGRIRVCPKGFGHFEEWSTMLLEQEERELEKRQRLLDIEVEWASRGVKARRKRNMRRLEDMKKERERLKSDKSAYRRTISKVEFQPLTSTEISRIVAEFIKVNKSYPDTKILENFNLRIMKGDRIGILGKNGSGKSTFLKLLVGQTEPDSGKIKLAQTAEISYFDQKREDLNPNHSLWHTLCPGGGDYVNVMGKERHVCGYLKDFMFDPKNARDLVGTLSGGQKNRLLLAKVLAKPGNVLILDEPTNDLDMETLDMLEDVLSKYQGTLIVVSHDRDFLDQTVTQIIAFEGDGEIEGYIGGYSDYLASKSQPKATETSKKEPEAVQPQQQQKPAVTTNKLSYKLKFELEQLPAKIAALENEVKQLHHLLADAELYVKDPDKFDKTVKRIEQAEQELEQAEIRWLELSEMDGQ